MSVRIEKSGAVTTVLIERPTPKNAPPGGDDREEEAFDRGPGLPNLLVDGFFREAVETAQPAWRRVVAQAALGGIPTPAFASALAFYDGYRRARLPANLLQAQRDYFGTHTYERVDRPRGEFFHTNWTGRGGRVASTAYTA